MMRKLSRYFEGASTKGLSLGCAVLFLACSGEIASPGYMEPGPGANDVSDAAGTSGGTTGGVVPSGTGGAASGVTGSAVTSGGITGGTATGTTGAVVNLPYEPPVGLLRRLTRAQFGNAVSDLIGVDVDVSNLEADTFDGDFAAVGASKVATSELGVERYHEAIEAAVDAVFSDPTRQAGFIGCTPAAVDDSCVSGFLESMGRRAWRRPLDPTEVERLLGVAQTATTELGSVTEGVRWATVALFTSPNFFYRPELGAPDSAGNYRLTGHELASRLAFLIWNTGPDDQLLDEAAAGAFATADGVRTVAERLLQAPAGRESVSAFAEEYMRLDRVLTQAKDTSLFPEYGPVLQQAMVRDMREVWASNAFDDDASALDLFTTTKVYVNAELAVLYGNSVQGLTSDSFQFLELPVDSPRVGILGKAGFLSQFANQKEGSPTLRGKFIREAIMCQEVEPPPGDVALELPEPTDDAPKTKRQRLADHSTVPVCAGCHGLMDPMGLPLETFDAIGRYRTLDYGLPIDPSGNFDGTPVADARELGTVMSASETVAACLVRKYYSYALGHVVRDVDATVIQALTESFHAAGYRLRPLILDITAGEAFAAVAPQP
jgi:hypothetical protein